MSDVAKSKQRGHSKNEAHYRAQFMITYRNKLKRVAQSSGQKAAAAYQAKFFEIALKKSSGR